LLVYKLCENNSTTQCGWGSIYGDRGRILILASLRGRTYQELKNQILHTHRSEIQDNQLLFLGGTCHFKPMQVWQPIS
jgi:hypothetical protein